MNHLNLLRTAVEKRKSHLIELLNRNHAVSNSVNLKALTLSELEDEWKRYCEWREKGAG
jgi:hypothetical protein